ncbi:MAG TPA: VWA domain-containing protein [Candidatus Limnocylindrales bacterium]|nr:VWA domain-containing protein [Candidatus Limnocylindrales bacterium]
MMSGLGSGARELAFLLAMAVIPLSGQQNIPDAPKPKANQPAQFPGDAPPAPKNPRPAGDSPAAQPDATPPPAVPRNQQGLVTSRNDLYTFSVAVNFVQVPVTVQDSSGHLVTGLGPKDFTVLEDGVAQQLKFFTSDAFPLSAAVVLDTDLPSTTMRKVNESLPALIGAFSEFDEVALYRYGHTVQMVSSFTGATNVSTPMLNKIKRPGREGGPPMVGGGPFSHSGPMINGHEGVPGQMDSGSNPQPVQESYVLNDAILRAAQDLSRRPRDRRRIIFVISDGRELGSNARYDEVKKVLLANNIQVYALGVDTAAIPIYDRLNRIRVPGFGYGNILPKYVSDTAGKMYAEFDRGSIEAAYARITDVARNQYTLGYTTRVTASTGYRTIEVRVHRSGLTVLAKQGYYPLPPQHLQRQQPLQ